MSLRWVLSCGVLLAVAAPAAAQRVAIRAGHVIVRADQPALESATVLLEEGRVLKVGRDLDLPGDVRAVDRPDAWIVPAFVDASSGVGLVGDRDERTGAIQADVSTRWWIDPAHPDFAAARAAGVGTTFVSPGDRDLFGGEGAVVDARGEPRAAVAKLALGVGTAKAGQPPTSRAGALDLLKRTLAKAQGDQPPETPFERFARGAVPGVFAVGSTLDVQSAYALVAPYGLRLAVSLGDRFEVKDLEGLSLEGRSVVVGPYTQRTGERTLRVAAALAERGARLAFASEAPRRPMADLRLTAALAVQAGLPAEQALLALTQGGAQALGVGDHVGSLEPGKQGDMVVLSGPPLDLGSRVLELYLAGRRVYRRPAPEGEDR